MERPDRFIPGIILGIIGAAISILPWLGELLYAHRIGYNTISILQLLIAACTIIMGFQGEKLLRNRKSFYPLFAMFIIQLVFCLVSNTLTLIVSFPLEGNAGVLFIIYAAFTFAASVCSSLCVCFLFKKNDSRLCRIMALLSLVFTCLSLLLIPNIIFSGPGVFLGVVNWLELSASGVLSSFSSVSGSFFATWALFLYAGKYLPKKTLSKSGREGQATDVAVAKAVSKTGKYWVTLLIVAVGIACIVLLIGICNRVWYAIKEESRSEPAITTVLDDYYAKKYKSDIPTVTTPIKDDSDSEIHFRRKDVGIEILGIGIDSDDNTVVVAEVTNNSDSTVEFYLNGYESLVNGYPIDINMTSLIVRGQERFRFKMIIDPVCLTASRIHEVTSAYMSFGMAYGEDFARLDMGGKYDCAVYFDAVDNFAEPDYGYATYEDEDMTLVYQGMFPDRDTEGLGYMVFYLENFSNRSISLQAEKIIPYNTDRFSYIKAKYTDPSEPKAYIYYPFELTDPMPQTILLNFSYHFFGHPAREDVTFSLEIDPDDMFREK